MSRLGLSIQPTVLLDERNVAGYKFRMITSFRHKGLKALYESGNTRGLKQDQVKRLRIILSRLPASHSPADMDLPGLRLHPLRGDLAGFHAVSVSGHWRLVFRFDEHGNAVDVDLIDYH